MRWRAAPAQTQPRPPAKKKDHLKLGFSNNKKKDYLKCYFSTKKKKDYLKRAQREKNLKTI